MGNQLTSKSEVKIEYDEFAPQKKEETNIGDSTGLIESVSSTPTGIPRRFSEQFKVSAGIIYFYDQGSETWYPIGVDTVYGGRVTSNASGTPFPTGWSLSHGSTGFYTITHNLGHSNYVVAVTLLTNPGRANISSDSTTSFTVRTQNASGSDADFDFYFVVTDES